MDFNSLMAKMRELDQPMAEATVDECSECGGDNPQLTPSSPTPNTPPPSLSVNLNAQGLDNIAELIKLIAKAEAGDEGHPELPALTIGTPGMSLSGDADEKQAPLPSADLDDDEGEEQDEWANTPDTEVGSIDTLVNKLAGGPNAPKQMHKHSYRQGDNPMAMPESIDLRAQIRAELAQRLAEAKGAK